MNLTNFRTIVFATTAIWCTVAGAQTPSARPGNQTVNAPSEYTEQPRPDQDPGSRSRVAAPVEQIRAVLTKDPGLLVELERVVEKEAISKGKLVEDSDLTEQAIFDRLDEDAALRATATRLLQRYGYLLPNVNPDSEMAKQQDLVLKERARRIVQIEAQEDAESMQLQKHGEDSPELANTGKCDARSDSNCREPASRRLREDPRTAPNRDLPGGSPDIPPYLIPNPQMSGSPLMQTRL